MIQYTLPSAMSGWSSSAVSCCGRSGETRPVVAPEIEEMGAVRVVADRPSDQRVRHVGIGYLLVDLHGQAPAIIVGRAIPSAKVGHLVEETVDCHRLAELELHRRIG